MGRFREILQFWQIIPPTVDGQLANTMIRFPLSLKEEVKRAEIYDISNVDVAPKPIKQVYWRASSFVVCKELKFEC